MIVNEIAVNLDSTLYSHETHVRSGGVHLSHVIRSIEETIYGKFKGEGIEQQKMEAYRTAGFLFERALYDTILRDETVERLGEFEYDGIVMTPDAINLSTGRGIESKCTWRSFGKEDVTDVRGGFASWWMQIQGYAMGLGVLKWDLWVMFMNGDYKENRGPTLKKWEITLEQEEVEANWRMIKNHSIWMLETGEGKPNGHT